MKAILGVAACALAGVGLIPVQAQAVTVGECLVQPVDRAGNIAVQAGPFAYPGAESVEVGCDLRAGAIDGPVEVQMLTISPRPVGTLGPDLRQVSLTPGTDYYTCTSSRAYPNGVRKVHSCAFAFTY